jgi:hypothetical protein
MESMEYKTMDEPEGAGAHNKAFLAFAKAMNREMAPIWERLNRPLSDVVEEMKGQMREIDGYKARIVFLLAEARHYLANACVLKKPPKSSELTDLDRKAVLDARTGNERRLVQVLEGTLGVIENRISMGQTILKDETMQRKVG